jgi:colicin import membrane protein
MTKGQAASKAHADQAAPEHVEHKELDQVNKAVAEFDRVAAGLGALQEAYGGVVFDVSNTKGMEAAKEARKTIRDLRYGVEHTRTDAKAPIIDLGKTLDSEAKRITEALMAIEEPIHLQIKNEEERVEREKQARIDAEVKRVADIQDRIEKLRGSRTLTPSSGAAWIKKHIDDLVAIPVDESFEEFKQQASDAKGSTLHWLTQLYDAAQAYETEQVRIAAERAELARLKAEQAARDAADQARRDEEASTAKAAADAEAARVAEENRKTAEAQRAESDRLAAEAKRIADANAQLERDRAAAAAPVQTPPPRGRTAPSADLGNGMIVQRGDDGHWIRIKHGGKQAAINVEVLLGRTSIGSDVFIGWIDAQIEGKKKSGT